MELDGRPVQVIPYPTVAKVSEIEYAFKYFDYRYDPNASTNSKLQNMPSISKLFEANYCGGWFYQ